MFALVSAPQAANDNVVSGFAGKFIVGRTYSTRSICDHDCIFSFTVTARTDKTVTLRYHGKETRRKIRLYDGIERCDPMGRFSMSPVLTATD